MPTPRRSLAPRLGRTVHLLVLGSFPGVRSLDDGAYYAHPRNRFWPTLAPLCGLPEDAAYATRIAALRRRGVGLWDVLHSCRRVGSLDQRIERESEVPNDIGAVVAAHPELRAIALNGGTAAALFARHILPRDAWPALDVAIELMPSTSPAHAAIGLPALRAAWAALFARHGVGREL